VRAQIGTGLGARKFNSILVDVSPEYTGDLQADGLAINQVIFQALYFSNMFLEKGGNFVCKVLNCESTKVLEVTVDSSRTTPRYSSTKLRHFGPQF
jgi:23S rRNA U2552 (ribose-2'-O)-methylase RlmE/FtsJ